MTPQALIAPARLAGAPLLRTQTDERLVDLVRAGNDGAFEAIVARYRRPLMRYCCGILPEARAEDVVQQTFVRAYDSLQASTAEMHLRPWLYRIAHNAALNSLRERAHEQLLDSIDGVERPDEAFEKHERLRDVVTAVGALPGRQRDAIVLRELEGRSYDEIASELGVSGGAVRQLLNRARSSLRAGFTALVPFGVVARVPASPGTDDVGARVAELCTAGAGGALLTKACATALVTGAVVGGVATVPDGGPGDGRASGDGGAAVAAPGGGGSSVAAGADEERLGGAGDDDDARRGRGGDEDRSGPSERSGRRDGDDDEDDDEDSSGPGSGDDDDDDSGSGSSGSDDDDSGSSGSGSNGSGSSGSGSGSSGSGSGSSGSGSSGSGSDSSGSGSSGSGSGSSGSDSSGSGSDGDGSGSSGTDSGSTESDSSGSGSDSSGSDSSRSGSG